MTHNAVRTGPVALLMVIAVACGSGAAASPAGQPATFNDYDTAVCGAFTSLIRAYGNPDTNVPSVMRTTLEAAVTAGDAAAAQRAATAMHDELEAGRRLAAIAARWQPGAVTAASLDRLLLAYEAWTSAKLAIATQSSAVDPDTAFTQAGGADAWTATIQGISTTPVPAGASPTPCKAFSGQL